MPYFCSILVPLLLLLPFQIQALHHKLTKRELHHVFGVDHHHLVPEYRVVKPNKIWSDEGLQVSFDAWNETFHLKLKPNHRLISPHLLTVIRDGSNITEVKGLPTASCHFKGSVTSHNDAPVALSDCSTLLGTLHLQDHFLVLHPIPKRIQHEQEGKHVVFKRAAGLLSDLERHFEEEVTRLQEHQEPFCDTSESADNLDPGPSLLNLNYSLPSAAHLDSPIIFPNLDPITLEIGLFLDSKLFEHFQREYILDAEQHLTDFALALINNVHVLYQQPSLSPNIEIVIVRFELWKSQPSNLETYIHKAGQAQTLLDAFCRHQAHINPGTDLTDMGHWDHGVLLTGYDIYHTTPSVAGVAPVARMCDPLFACSLVEGLHLGRSFVLAHEMGHNMGMVHDGVQNQCSRSCCLMSAVNGAGKTTWSECSVREINAFLMQLDETGRGNCLRDGSPGLVTFNHNDDSRLPGQRFTPDQQCAYFWGRDYLVEIPNGRSRSDICRILWCGNSGSTISTAHPALEGSYCGPDKWCHEGQCRSWSISQPGPPLPIDGGWSDWSRADKLCPISQCHVTGSITVKAQHRDCVSPAPDNGGTACFGSSIRGLLCGTSQSTCTGLSRQQFSDRICSAIKHDPIKPDRQLTGTGFDHSTQPCRVWCHLTDSELIRNKGQFPDGAPCGFGQFCVAGTCLPAGCDEKALVESEDDCPVEKRSLSHWNEWSSWSECSVSCGSDGDQIRTRDCFDPLGERCQGSGRESRPCSPSPAPCVDYSPWGVWSDCDRDCGTGRQTRKRTCLAGDCTEAMVDHRDCFKMGCWEEWSAWEQCTVSCGGGHRTRSRSCGDEACEGESEVQEDCNTQDCPVSESWGDWLPCSVSCGIGFQIRERLCNGVLCTIANKQARTCNEQPCPISSSSDDYEWAEWSEWTECSTNCGQGQSTRSRECKKGSCPTTFSMQDRRCVLKPCTSAWSHWSSWSICGSCERGETRERTRECTSADSSITLSQCEGESKEIQSCSEWCDPSENNGITRRRHIDIITAKGAQRVAAHGGRLVSIEPSWQPWNEWTRCSERCGGGSKRRTRLCLGQDCPPQPLESQREVCNDQPCEYDRYWSTWTEWTDCSASCGSGTQMRRRRCNAFFVFQCSGHSQETQGCDSGIACENSVASDDSERLLPKWSNWSPWSACSCFTSMKTRRRYCRILDPAVQGFCTGPILEQKSCSPTSCAPSAGGWSSWSQWSRCSQDCHHGVGHQIRNRMCSEPIPANRGSYCVGYSFDQRSCVSDDPCGSAVDGSWTDWTQWSQCSDPCVKGHKSRSRYCANPRPSQDGKTCDGSDFELQPCSDPKQCSQQSSDGTWSSWSPWSSCPQICEVFALQSRQRICEGRRGQGSPCSGIAQQTIPCTRAFCQKELDPADAEWSTWKNWSDCVGNCGIGSRTRIRSCVSASVGGEPCFGRSFESESCIASPQFCSQFVHHTQAVDQLIKGFEL